MENLTITQIREKLLKKEFSAEELLNYYLRKIEQEDSKLNAYITVASEQALKSAKHFDNNFETEKDKKLGGVPLAIKDVFSTKDILTTCASHILDEYKPVYESTVTSRLISEGAIILGKTNLDQFCHGSSTVTSYYGPTRNPFDMERLPGGSSGGSAAATAADLCAGSLGTETAGSLRLPASWCGIVGLKPTYGRVSRYGVLAMGSSLDCPGPLTKSVEDSALILSVIAGYDPKDFTSYKDDTSDYLLNLNPSLVKGMRIAIPKEYLELEIEEGVLRNFEKDIEILKRLGADIQYVNILNPSFGMAVYTVTCRSEVSSNLARYDGTRYGLEGKDKSSIKKYYESTRGEGFGQEPKRRVMTGTYSLSAGYADEYFKKSEQVRQLIKENLNEILKEYDCITSPTTPTIALKDKDADNPLFGEMADILAEGSSEAGLPAISIPNGKSENMPTGIQFIGKTLDEQTVLNVAKALEGNLN
ncbi:MAG: aspartyl/glutamyl-tRNA amidotransferase subunit A, aspartyl-tRNA(Asn)/glutamyl-tRNA (Gln) amidotransferase subunit A [candidate division WS6 bacterium GW2011_GWC1_33_20]|uniref:Glutamyl-tRNA(Gln) amidotransferase subunit A n=2 Tax=Candidatus Dojkabacteria TaxID=74243 RepID=A0A0G0DI91_9BACT|nr:MAG: aspartyl/glutamyl-tRNA amidotransferase subunit A, aspartyl-tRNA(Asn)/glutamyl-tRNA (Gln) amidotransferase subunit A [candidate division WS6 bacterium GW2011_GWE2_33_157]KKP44182.1 MAG: aspartyl/glutamyl-tRNA amidotransferase subunit A, aspartyl-tRNA(Asn)/glutamyl-tRNA (Gln) amidotransferase subunit A [candidate division WS6 bacterium GW2011_GWC1_33_20]KKP45761.1 MAG: aspartyl/glutamyl-tRNA amidotransferase subunit A, aspartyl-tRNA(Asn)/glutamyl-tRNA (Gln) amidotransferase subunit A [cand